MTVVETKVMRVSYLQFMGHKCLPWTSRMGSVTEVEILWLTQLETAVAP